MGDHQTFLSLWGAKCTPLTSTIMQKRKFFIALSSVSQSVVLELYMAHIRAMPPRALVILPPPPPAANPSAHP